MSSIREVGEVRGNRAASAFAAFWIVSVLLAIGLVALYVWAADGGFPLDDSWIHQVYARNLAQSGEWSFVPGQPSGGSTSPLYTALLALGYALGVPYAAWTHGLGVLALAAAGVIGFAMAWRLAAGWRWVAVAAGLAVLLAWHLVWAAASGMETMLFATWTLVLVWLAWREFDAIDTGRAVWRGALYGLVAALTVMTRPEGAMLAGLGGLAVVGLRPHGLRAAVAWGGGAALAFVVGIAPYLALNLHLTGGLLPNTSAAKQAQHAPLLALPFARRFADMLLPVVSFCCCPVWSPSPLMCCGARAANRRRWPVCCRCCGRWDCWRCTRRGCRRLTSMGAT
ncbi:MAG: hypothetical protein ACOCZH_01445 [Phototrophicaceae bacterium]